MLLWVYFILQAIQKVTTDYCQVPLFKIYHSVNLAASLLTFASSLFRFPTNIIFFMLLEHSGDTTTRFTLAAANRYKPDTSYSTKPSVKSLLLRQCVSD